jgi:hypothetical protein
VGEITEVEMVVARALMDADHEIRRQVKCGGGRCDIFDDTTGEIIECKILGDVISINSALRQLDRYRHHFFDPQMAIAIPRILPEAEWLIPSLQARNIRIIEVEKGICV